MNIRHKYKALGVLAGMLMLTSCDQDKDVAPVMDASTKPVITITRIGDNASASTITEGDILEFELKTSKWMRTATDFVVESDDMVEGADFEVITPGTIPAFGSTGVLRIELLRDDNPEPTEEFNFRIVARDIAQTWKLNPASLSGDAFSVNVENVNKEGVISIALSWPDEHDDIDMYIFSETEDDDWGGNDSATGSNPEINTNLWPSDPDGVYYVGIDPYHLETGETPYKFSIGFEDGSIQSFEGVFNQEAADAAEWPMDGGHYRLLKITISNGDVTIEHLND